MEIIPNKKFVLEEPDIKEFIKSRKINPEDFHFLEELSFISKQLLIMDFHNFFSFNKERSESELENLLALLENEKVPTSLSEPREKLYKLLLDFVRKYNWAVAWNLVSVFERMK